MTELTPPIHSEEPADWFMFCDMLQDAGCSRYVWQNALRIAKSLESCPGLVLAYCHRLSSGRYAFLPLHYGKEFYNVPLRCVWLRNEWIPLLSWDSKACSVGTIQSPSRLMAPILSKEVHQARCRQQFFYAHSLRRLPSPSTHFANRF